MTKQEAIREGIKSLIPMLNHTNEILTDALKVREEFEISDEAYKMICAEISNAHDVLLNITNMVLMQDQL